MDAVKSFLKGFLEEWKKASILIKMCCNNFLIWLHIYHNNKKRS